MPSPRRWFVFLTVCLLFGVVLTVVTAWMCALRVTPRDVFPAPPPDESDVAWFGARAPASFDRELGKFGRTMDGFGVTHRALWSPFEIRPGQRTFVPQWRIRAGWPMRAMEGSLWRDGDASYGAPVALMDVSLPKWGLKGQIPLRPDPVGFLVDTILAALAPFVLTLLLVTIRWFVRIHRGRCPACGYPAGASPVCTECGGRVRSRHLAEGSSEVS